MRSRALTLDIIKRAFEYQVGAKDNPTFFVCNMTTLETVGSIGQVEALKILDDMCATTRPIFGNILVGLPDWRKAANWWLSGGPWPYTAPDPEPPAAGTGIVALERTTTSFWRASLHNEDI